MTKEEIIERLKNLGTIEDEVERRDELTSVIDEVEGTYSNFETIQQENETLKGENEKLIDYNRKLFMKVSINESPEKVEEEKTGSPVEKEPRKFEDLFNENGDLKLK